MAAAYVNQMGAPVSSVIAALSCILPQVHLLNMIVSAGFKEAGKKIRVCTTLSELQQIILFGTQM